MKKTATLALLTVVLIAGGSIRGNAQENRLSLVGVALDTIEESPLMGVYIHKNYAFIGGMTNSDYGPEVIENMGVRIVDLADPVNPQLVGRIPLRLLGSFADHSHGDAVATHLATDSFEGDVAIVLYGVPDDFSPADYRQPYGLWDVTEPNQPEFLSILNLGKGPLGGEGGGLGDKPYDAKAVAGHFFYALYDQQERSCSDCNEHDDPPDNRLAIVDIADPRKPQVVGDWQDNPAIRLYGLTLNEDATRAYITGRSTPPRGSTQEILLYVIDIQDPTQPIEIGRYFFLGRGAATSPWIARPTPDDQHVVLAEGVWGLHGPTPSCGVLLILDTSDPANIHKVSEFALEESFTEACENNPFFFATDVAIKGNTVYSAWMGGGVRAIDISDPAQPVEVGHFLHPQAPTSFPPSTSLSDVAFMEGGYVVASTVWGEGLFVLHDSGLVSTNVAEESPQPDQYGLGQNYPNPFNAQTVIQFALPTPSHVDLAIFNLMGQKIVELADGMHQAGNYTIRWDGRDNQQQEIASGLYLYRLRAGSQAQTRKLMLLR